MACTRFVPTHSPDDVDGRYVRRKFETTEKFAVTPTVRTISPYFFRARISDANVDGIYRAISNVARFSFYDSFPTRTKTTRPTCQMPRRTPCELSGRSARTSLLSAAGRY